MEKKETVPSQAYEGNPDVMVKHIAFSPHPQVSASCVGELFRSLGYEKHSDHPFEDMCMIQFKGKAAPASDEIEAVLVRMAEELGVRYADVTLRLPVGGKTMKVVMVADSMKNVTTLEWEREASRRESRGGAPLTPEQEAECLSIDRRDEDLPEVIAIEGEEDLALFRAELKLALDRTMPHELSSGHISELVDDARDGDVLRVERLAVTLADAVRVPLGLARMIVTGARRPVGNPIAAIDLNCDRGEFHVFIGRSGELSGNPGFQRLVRDCIGNEREATAYDAFKVLVHTITAASFFDMREDARLAASDQGQFSSRVRRAIERGDVQGIGDIYAQLPAQVARQIVEQYRMLTYADVDANMKGDDHPIDTSKADMLATEPVFPTGQMLNYGSRWRRLDSPDHLILSENLDEPLLPYAWVRTMDDTETTRDFAPFRKGGPLGLPGDAHDHSDVVWMVGLGPDPWHVEPLYVTIVERDYVTDGRMNWHIHNTSQVAPNPSSRLTHDMQGALAVALHSQFLDDMEWQHGKAGRIAIMIDTTDPVPSGKEEADRLLSYRFMNMMIQSVNAFRARYGSNAVEILRKTDDGREYAVPLENDEVDIPDARHDAVSLRSQVPADAWGVIALERDFGPLYIVVPAPEGEDPAYDQMLGELAEQDGPLTISDDDLDIMFEEIQDLQELGVHAETPSFLQAAMTIAGRAVIARDETNASGDGLTFFPTPPGVIPVSLLSAKLTGREYARGFDHVFSDEWIKEEERFSDASDDIEDIDGEELLSILESSFMEGIVNLMGAAGIGGFEDFDDDGNPFARLDDPDTWETVVPTALEVSRRLVIDQLVVNGDFQAQDDAARILRETTGIEGAPMENDPENAHWFIDQPINTMRFGLLKAVGRMVEEAGCEQAHMVVIDGGITLSVMASESQKPVMRALKDD